MTGPRSRGCSSSCSSTPTPCRPRRSCSTSTRPTTRCTAARKAGRQLRCQLHGYCGCYCHLPLYVFCGDHLLAARLRRSSIDASAGAVAEVERIVAQIRARWPEVRIILRADSGFAREPLMVWCESHQVGYVPGLARNPRLVREIASELGQARAAAEETGKAARCFRDFHYQTLDTWSRERRVVGKAEQLVDGSGETSPNPRFVVTSLTAGAWAAKLLYGQLYCARGEPPRSPDRGPCGNGLDRLLRSRENRIKECQPDQPRQRRGSIPARADVLGHRRGADRTSAAGMRANRRQRRCRPALVRVDGPCAARGAAADRPEDDPAGPGHRRHHPPRAAQDRRPGPGLGAPGHGGQGQLCCPSRRGIGQSPMASGHPWQQDWAIAHRALAAAAL